MDTKIAKEIERAVKVAVAAAVVEQLRGGVVGDGTPLPQWVSKRKLLEMFDDISYVTVWGKICRGEFPKAKMIHGRCMWNLDEIHEWIAEQPKQRVKGNAEDWSPAAGVSEPAKDDPPATGGA